MQETESVLRAYGINGAIDEIALLGFGHINDSYKVKQAQNSFLLQKINSSIFQYYEALENNLNQLLEIEFSLFPIHKKAEGKYHLEFNAALWRLSEFVENSYSPFHPSFEETLEAVRGYGNFMSLNKYLDVFQFQETIHEFHHLDKRLTAFELAVEIDFASRGNDVKHQIGSIRAFSWIEEEFLKLKLLNLPIRVCHNDTKSTNVLLDNDSKQLLKVVDLDTVGPGYALYDFGDMMRSMLASHPENAPDIGNLSILEDRYQHMLETYVESANGVLTDDEIESLGFGGLYMTYLMAIRFLTDYLNGDVYYRIAYTNENLVRAKNQIKLLELMKEVIQA